MKKWSAAAFLAAVCAVVASLGAASAVGAHASGVQISVLTTFPAGGGPSATAATNTGDVLALAGPNIVGIGPGGKQTPFPVSITGGAFGFAIGTAYDKNHQLYTALPGSFGPSPSGAPGILKVSSNGKSTTPVPGSEGMVAADGFGLDSATGYMYVTDIFGNGIWRFKPGGPAQLWTSIATNPLLLLPDGVKIFQGAAYVSIEGGKILRIPINADGTAGTATVWAQINAPGVFFDDLVLDDWTGDVYVTRLDTNELLQITPGGTITPVATNADGLLGAANMTLIHQDHSTIIYLANGAVDFLGTGQSSSTGPSVLKITIT
jgi:hypothetical protein